MGRGWVRVAAAVIGIGVIALAWLGLGPRSLGGSVDYVAVAKGSSMEPTFRVGDLAITRPAPAYRVGDVVATRTDFDRIVLHRIVSIEGDRFITKGDNNADLDQYQPLRGDVMGALWVRVPAGARFLAILRPPFVFLPVGIILAAWLLVARPKPDRRRTTKRRQAPRAPSPLREGAPATLPETMFGGAMVALIVCAVIALMAFSRPTRTAAERSLSHAGSFRYAASVSDGSEDRIETGEPAFLRLTRSLRVFFTYALESEGTRSLGGDWRMVSELRAPNGWRRVVPLTPVTPYQGDSLDASGLVDLRALRGIILETEDRTGVVNPTYSLIVRADVHTYGTVDGASVDEAFAPEMRFTMDAMQVQLQATDHVTGEPVTIREEDSMSLPGAAANHLLLVKVSIPVPLARALGLGGMAVALVLMGAAAIVVARAKRKDVPARIAARWSRALIAVDEPIVALSAVTVASFEDLARLAERYDRQILHHVEGTRHTYAVEEGARTYRYVAYEDTLQEEPPVMDLTFLRPALDRRHA